VAALTDLWRPVLVRARWFQGKGLPVGDVVIEPLPWYTPDGDVMVRSELARVQVGETSETYHLLAGYLPPGQAEPDALVGQTELPGHGLRDVVDTPRSPRAMAAFLAAVTNPGTPGVTWLGPPPPPDAPTKVFAGEQSNTTVRVGDDVLFKMFRHLSPGPNIEASMMAALRDSGITPRLVGTLSTIGGAFDLGLFAQRIKGATEGWKYCVDAFGQGRPVDDEMRALGVTLRRLHGQLAAVFGTSVVDGRSIAAQMLARLDAACEQVTELDEMKVSLSAILDLGDNPVEVQRVHGDFHLGQTLTSPDGWKIIDFEGEPLKTPAERAAPDAVWRDVAGLLRSLDYARHHDATADDDAGRGWYESARRAFLDGYLGGDTVPQAMLTAYEVDKAVYELVYETRNRPAWARIPRAAIMEALSVREG